MDPRQRLYRAVNWALGLSVFTLVVLVFVIFFVQPAAMLVVRAAAQMKAGQDTRPSQDAPEAEWDEWNTRQQPVRDATYHVAEGALKLGYVVVGLPVAVLLVVVIVLLYRARGYLRRGV